MIIKNTGTAPTALLLNGEILNVTGGQLSLDWPSEQALSAKSTVDMENGAITLTVARSVKADALVRSATLAQMLTAYCEEKKIAIDFKTLGFPRILAFLTGRTLSETSGLLYEQVPSALIKFISVDQKIDIDRSTAIVHPAAISNGVLVEKAELVLNISKTLTTVNDILKLADLNIKFEEVGLTLANVGRVDERMTLHGGVKIENISLSCKVEMAEARPTSQLGAVLWTFTATSTNKLSELSNIWRKNQNDLTPEGAVPFSTLKVSEMKNEGVGFTLTQPLASVPKYKLYSVYLATQLNAWKTYLPAEFPSSTAGLEARLEIRYPLDSKLRAYGARVTFDAPITTSKGDSSLRVSLSAEPLATPADYAYRLFIGGADQGMTIMDIAKAIRLGDKIHSMTESLPLVKGIFEKVRLKALGIALRNQDGAWKMDDFQLELTVDRFELGKNLTVKKTELSLDYSLGIWDSRVYGELLIVSRAVKVEFVMPSLNTIGKCSPFIARQAS